MEFTYSNAYLSMVELGISESLGNVLNAGTHTVVVKPFYWLKNTKVENPVLIITTEEEKIPFLKSLYKDSSVQIEDVNIESYTDDYQEIFQILSSRGFYFCYSTELKPIELKDFYLFDSFSEASGFGTTRYSSIGFPVEYLLESYAENYLFFSQQDTISKDIEKILASVKKSFEIIKEGPETIFMIDLHEKQFLSHNDEIFCVDPALYDFQEYCH